MGNCLKRQSSMIWAGDDWEGVVVTPHNHTAYEKEGLLGYDDDDDHGAFSSSASSALNGEIKIKITKTQLEDLLKRLRNRKVPADQVLFKLIDASEHWEVHRQRSWRPHLQSIPEVN